MRERERHYRPSGVRTLATALILTTTPNGMGMGLSICQTIIEAHGGRLWAESNQNQGASFRFTLPVSNGALHE